MLFDCFLLPKQQSKMASRILYAENTHDIIVTTAVVQNGKGQDQPFFGETASGRRYFGIWDGHGTNSVIQALRGYIANGKLAAFMENSSPVCTIADHLIRNRICRTFECSGATMNFGILDGNVLTCTNCGDSKMFVFKNGELIFQSEEHNFANEKERTRLGNTVSYEKSYNIKVVSESTMIGVYSEYVVMKNTNRLALTQALGHDGFANPCPDEHRIEIAPTDEIVAVSVSDGVTDMLCYDEQNNIVPDDIRMIYELSAEDLKNRIQARWLQPWIMINMEGVKEKDVTYNKSDCDDVGITRFVMRPKI
jgi:serine/threonine protein phosphatase PrpC